ncbi:hypothetical protein ACFQZ4_19310 [Catellatospora coxensis]
MTPLTARRVGAVLGTALTLLFTLASPRPRTGPTPPTPRTTAPPSREHPICPASK